MTDKFQIDFSGEELNKAIGLTIEPFVITLYQPAPQTGVVLSGGVENKVAPTIIPAPAIPIPNGFGPFVTLQGDAIRFIGTGLGNGDTGKFQMLIQLALESTSAAADFEFKLKTRPYTETDFANAVDIVGAVTNADVAINKADGYNIAAPLFDLSDGDLIELAIIPSTGVTININSLSLTLRQIIE